MNDRDQYIAQGLKDMGVQLCYPLFGEMYYICDPSIDELVSSLLSTVKITKKYWKSLRKQERRIYYRMTTVQPTTASKPVSNIYRVNFINHID